MNSMKNTHHYSSEWRCVADEDQSLKKNHKKPPPQKTPKKQNKTPQKKPNKKPKKKEKKKLMIPLNIT